MNLILIIILSSLFCFGWEYTLLYTPINGSEENPYGESAINKQINWWFRFYIGNFICKYVPKLKPILKPLGGCVVCMSSIYGSLIYWMMSLQEPVTFNTFLWWPVCITAVAGLNRILTSIIQR